MLTAARLSAIENSLFKPLTFLFSGICVSPCSLIYLTDLFVISAPSSKTLPFSTFLSPVIASISSLCPFPSTPAIPTISPDFTSRDRPLIFDISFSPEVHISFTSSTVPFTSDFFFSIFKKTSLPIIILASSSAFVLSLSTVPMYSPALITEILSEISITSLSLCEMNTMDFPSSLSLLSISNNLVVSIGVRTAVGSSNMMILAPLVRVFIISTL